MSLCHRVKAILFGLYIKHILFIISHHFLFVRYFFRIVLLYNHIKIPTFSPLFWNISSIWVGNSTSSLLWRLLSSSNLTQFRNFKLIESTYRRTKLPCKDIYKEQSKLVAYLVKTSASGLRHAAHHRFEPHPARFFLSVLFTFYFYRMSSFSYDVYYKQASRTGRSK